MDENVRKNAAVSWSHPRGGPITPTPLLYRGKLYVLEDMGILSCFDGRTGKLHFRARLPGNFFSSPVAARGKVYLANLDGDVFVIRAGRSYRPIAVNSLDEGILASPAVSDGMILFRSLRHLTAIAPMRREGPSPGAKAP